jgi:hypothetical protein
MNIIFGSPFSLKSLRTALRLLVVLIVWSHVRPPVSVFAQPTTLNFSSISITPTNPIVRVGRQTMLGATAAFGDGSSQNYVPGEWDVFFSPQIDNSPCPPLQAGVAVFASQQVLATSSGSFHAIWGTPQDVVADGTMTSNSFSAVLTCLQGGAALGSISGNWAGTEFDGTFTASRNSGSVIIRGITWTSSNPGVATIDATGTVTGVSPGVTTITATYGAVCKKVGGEPPVPTWGCQGTTSGSTILTVAVTSVAPPDDNNDSGPIQSGYAIITPISGAPVGGLLAFASFGLKQSNGNTAQAGVLPATMTTNAFVGVATDSQLQRDLGLAFVNPGTASANVTLTLRRSDGSLVENKSEAVAPGNHGALFVSQIFSDQSSVLSNFTGTLSIASDNPIAVVGLQFRGVEFSTILIASLSAAVSVPTVSPGVGGPGAVILPDFAEDGGWSTQFSIANPGTSTMTARLDVFDSNGKPLQITLNGTKQSTFNVTVNPDGVAILAPVDGATGQSRF